MNVKTICLAILTQGETTGYDIRKRSTEGDYAYFMEASFGSIYPALSKLEEEGYVTSRTVAQEGKPSKRVYKITETGRTFFINSLYDELNDDVFRSEFLLFLRFVEDLPRSLVEKRVNERIAKCDDAIENVKKLEKEFTKPSERWVLNFGQHCMRSARQYLIENKNEILALAQQEDVPARAAE
jgi:DNA-binding PadR family transcriptional regulator